MSKITKRLLKHINVSDNAIVIEQKFGYIEDLVQVFDNVFYISKFQPPIKVKNLIYRNDFSEVVNFPNITNIFLDPSNVSKINEVLPIITKYQPNIIINDETVIDRNKSKLIWDIGYRPIDVFFNFQLWTKCK